MDDEKCPPAENSVTSKEGQPLPPGSPSPDIPPPKGPQDSGEDTGRTGKPPISDSGMGRVQANASEATLFQQMWEFFRQFRDIVGNKFEVTHGSQFIDPQIHYHLHTDAPSRVQDPGIPIVVDFADLVATFIPPVGWENALELLRQAGALIISGDPGNGRRTLAYYLLHMLESSDSLIFRQLGSTRVLLDLDEEAFAQVEMRRGYVLVPNTYELVEELKLEKIERLVTRIRQKQSYLIIVCPQAIPLPLVSWRFAITRRNLPKPVDVYRKHLSHLMEQGQIQGNTPDDLLNCSEISQILADAPNLKRAAQIAAFVANLLEMGSTAKEVAEECRQLRAQWIRQDALEAIENTAGMASLCLLFTAAVMSDIHVDLFKGLAEGLRQVFAATFSKQDNHCWKQIWAGRRSQWLEAAHAQVTPVTEWVGGRRVRVDVIKIVPEVLGIPLIDIFWDEYPQYRDQLCTWLESCGRHENFRVRLAAARAAGILSLRDPIRIEQSIIMPWVITDDVAVQESAAMSMAITCNQSSSATQSICQRLEAWIEDDNTRPRVIFATAIIYAWIGMNSPDRFLAGIHKLVNSKDVWVLEVTAHSATVAHTSFLRLSSVRFAFQRFLQLGKLQSGDYLALFRHMVSWNQSNSVVQRRIAREVFVDMMLTDEAVQPYQWQEEEENPPHGWPILLQSMHRAGDTSGLAAHLFEDAASNRGTWLATMGGVKHMIISAGRDPAAQPALKQLLEAIFRRPQNQAIKEELVRRMVHWARSAKTAAYPAPYSKELLIWLRHRNMLPSRSKGATS